MLELAGTILIPASVAIVLVAIVVSLDVPVPARVALAAGGAAWVGVVVAVVGELRPSAPLTLGFFAFPIVTAIVLPTFSERMRELLLRIPAPAFVAANVLRVFGILFVFLAFAGRLGGPFPYSAGIGDLIAGVFALPVARIAMREGIRDPRVVLWNAFGFLDLVVAVALGVLSRNGSPLQVIHAGAGSAALAALPWALVPFVLVPLFLIGHAVLFAQMRAGAPQVRTLSSPAA
jgi:hypothetical protein